MFVFPKEVEVGEKSVFCCQDFCFVVGFGFKVVMGKRHSVAKDGIHELDRGLGLSSLFFFPFSGHKDHHLNTWLFHIRMALSAVHDDSDTGRAMETG